MLPYSQKRIDTDFACRIAGAVPFATLVSAEQSNSRTGTRRVLAGAKLLAVQFCRCIQPFDGSATITTRSGGEEFFPISSATYQCGEPEPWTRPALDEGPFAAPGYGVRQHLRCCRMCRMRAGICPDRGLWPICGCETMTPFIPGDSIPVLEWCQQRHREISTQAERHSYVQSRLCLPPPNQSRRATLEPLLTSSEWRIQWFSIVNGGREADRGPRMRWMDRVPALSSRRTRDGSRASDLRSG